jgi:hypothetical protein
MSMARKLFLPGAGSAIERYTSAVADAAMYPGDFVSLSQTAPASQGVSGVVRSKTLGAADYVEVGLADTTAGASVLCLGVVVGKSIRRYSITSDVSPEVMADQDIVTILTYGVCSLASVASGGAAGEYLIVSSTVGEASNVTTAAAGLTGITKIIGVQMASSGTYTRATPTTNDGAICFVTCD